MLAVVVVGRMGMGEGEGWILCDDGERERGSFLFLLRWFFSQALFLEWWWRSCCKRLDAM